MGQVNIYEAKTQFSKLIARVAGGEEIVIAKAGKPVARLVPFDEGPARRLPGGLKGLVSLSETWDSSDTNVAVAALFETGPLQPGDE